MSCMVSPTSPARSYAAKRTPPAGSTNGAEVASAFSPTERSRSPLAGSRDYLCSEVDNLGESASPGCAGGSLPNMGSDEGRQKGPVRGSPKGPSSLSVICPETAEHAHRKHTPHSVHFEASKLHPF
jgi:hypothetical protein